MERLLNAQLRRPRLTAASAKRPSGRRRFRTGAAGRRNGRPRRTSRRKPERRAPKAREAGCGERTHCPYPQTAVREAPDPTNVTMAAAWCAGRWPQMARSSLHIGSRRCPAKHLDVQRPQKRQSRSHHPCQRKRRLAQTQQAIPLPATPCHRLHTPLAPQPASLRARVTA